MGPRCRFRRAPPALTAGRFDAVDPTSSRVTGLLSQAVYTRPDRIEAVKERWRKARG